MAFQNSPIEGNVPIYTTNTKKVNNYKFQYMFYYYLAPFKVSLSKSLTYLP